MVGACDKSGFELKLTPRSIQEDHWDENCYVCQAFAYEIEVNLYIFMILSYLFIDIFC